MILDDVFQFLKSAGLTPTHAVFSTEYLGHSPRYYDYLRCSRAKPSLRALLKLAMSLHSLAKSALCLEERDTAELLAQRVMTRALTQCR
ncbi:DUF6626 family protein [Novosphingobium sp. HII-3]|uniref:DUF6626 family protein n=1 Tax=Novosphingobium sp. HII-3 TaxID=2075565 RepID=UPI000CDB6B98|nr:DUF6626 family protein [Novosphingobium sp. HII-3]